MFFKWLLPKKKGSSNPPEEEGDSRDLYTEVALLDKRVEELERWLEKARKTWEG